MCDNLQNCCRICLDVATDHVSIVEDPSIQLHLKSCLDISICNNSDYPKNICFSCVAQLNDFYNFQMNARCSQDWIESCIQEKSKKASESKALVQPLPDSEYNSDSLLEFLNNTANIDEYLSNLGKEDIPAIVNMLDRNNENSMDTVDKFTNNLKCSPKKRPVATNCDMSMEIDVLDSDLEIVKEILMKEVEPKTKPQTEKPQNCFSCKAKFECVQKLAQHLTICETAQRTCLTCSKLFNSKIRMIHHRISHITALPTTCNCGKLFTTKDSLAQHYKSCFTDYTASLGCSYRCKQCNFNFTDRLQLYKHAKEHLKRKKACDICGHNFNGEAALLAHKKEHHKSDITTYRCKVCSYTTKDRKEIYLHITRHTKKSEPQIHLCESCGKSFTSGFTLKRHLVMHRNGECEQRSNSVNQTISSMTAKATEQVTDAEKVMCEHCGETVSNVMMLNLHNCASTVKE